MDAKAEKIALFRYGLIAPLVLETLPRGELTRRAQEIADRRYEIPGSPRISVGIDTLLLWVRHYRQGGFEALAPQPRHDRGQSRAITPQLGELIERLKRENPHRTGTTLLRELALSAGADSPSISSATLYRFLKQHGLTARQLLATPGHKKFQAEFSNQARKSPSSCWISQGFNSVAKHPECADHSQSAHSLRPLGYRWTPFLITYFPV
jgi:transposase